MRLVRTTFALLLASSSLVLHAQNFSSLEERMSQRDFESAGLQKLDTEELEFLNRWLQERGLTAPANAASGVPSDRIGLTPKRDPANEIVRSRLLGSFRGWTGNTVFRLENGQVWQQTGGGSFGGVSLESPEVTIQQGLLSAWYLRVEGYNSRAKVKRIE
jgi:hypothetical protein